MIEAFVFITLYTICVYALIWLCTLDSKRITTLSKVMLILYIFIVCLSIINKLNGRPFAEYPPSIAVCVLQSFSEGLRAFSGGYIDKLFTTDIGQYLPQEAGWIYQGFIFVAPFTTAGWLINSLTPLSKLWPLYFRIILGKDMIFFSELSEFSIATAEHAREEKTTYVIVFCRSDVNGINISPDDKKRQEALGAFLYPGTEEDLLHLTLEKHVHIGKMRPQNIKLVYGSRDLKSNTILSQSTDRYLCSSSELKSQDEYRSYVITSYNFRKYGGNAIDKKKAYYFGELLYLHAITCLKNSKGGNEDIIVNSRSIYLFGLGNIGAELLFGLLASNKEKRFVVCCDTKEEESFLDQIKQEDGYEYHLQSCSPKNYQDYGPIVAQIKAEIASSHNCTVFLSYDKIEQNIWLYLMMENIFSNVHSLMSAENKLQILCYNDDAVNSDIYEDRFTPHGKFSLGFCNFGLPKDLMKMFWDKISDEKNQI